MSEGRANEGRYALRSLQVPDVEPSSCARASLFVRFAGTLKVTPSDLRAALTRVGVLVRLSVGLNLRPPAV